MSSSLEDHSPDHLETVSLYALEALPCSEIAAFETHLAGCPECRRELQSLLPVVDCFAAWPTDVLRPPQSLWDRLARRIAKETGGEPFPAPLQRAAGPDWSEAAGGISVKLLAANTEANRLSLLVRMAPGAGYPPHRHNGPEDIYLLHGELVVNDRTLHPGEAIHAADGTVDHRVCSETGCTCVLIGSKKNVNL
jgi:putative transcriptional regulator